MKNVIIAAIKLIIVTVSIKMESGFVVEVAMKIGNGNIVVGVAMKGHERSIYEK